MSIQWNQFDSRRSFFKILGRFLLKSAALGGLVMTGPRSSAAFFKKRILPPGTDPRSLYSGDPEYLDTRNLEVSPIGEFYTAGDSRVEVDLGKWRLELAGDVRKPMQLSYPDIVKLPSFRKKVLLICPGIFAYHAEYTGISLEPLLKGCEASKEASRMVFYGRGESSAGKKERFRIREATEDRLFLAYSVNGQPLPRRHGFPLRLVAEDHHGDRWVKYVYKVKID